MCRPTSAVVLVCAVLASRPAATIAAEISVTWECEAVPPKVTVHLDNIPRSNFGGTRVSASVTHNHQHGSNSTNLPSGGSGQIAITPPTLPAGTTTGDKVKVYVDHDEMISPFPNTRRVVDVYEVTLPPCPPVQTKPAVKVAVVPPDGPLGNCSVEPSYPVTQADCDDWQGSWTEGVGSCCNEPTCGEGATQTACIQGGGFFLGVGSTCATSACQVTAVGQTGLPSGLELHLLGLNPASEEIRFRLDLPVGDQITVNLYDLSGRQVATLLHHWQPAGSFDFRWRRQAALANGSYYLRLRTVSGSVRVSRVVFLH